MDTENARTLNEVLTSIIDRNLKEETRKWLFTKASEAANKNNDYQLNLTFSSIPRVTGKKEIDIEEADEERLTSLLPGFSLKGWTVDRLCRVWLLLQLASNDEKVYINRIENLFPQAEMNELVALYSSLPILNYSQAWKFRCAEGIRSNIGTVLEAIMYYNPYPSNNLDDTAWNQLVLKAFFTDKEVNKIVGFDRRSNQNLADTLFDYVEERWAAGRAVNPQIWRLTGKYIDEYHFYMFEKLMKEGSETDKKAGALALSDSLFEKATSLLDQYPVLKTAIDQKKLTWQML